jgi:hypothetical protein
VDDDDDYAANALTHNNHLPKSGAGTSHQRCERSTANDGYNDNTTQTQRPKQKTAPAPAPTQPSTKTNNRDARRADKIVAMEEAREASKTGPKDKPKVPTKPVITQKASSKGKGKEREASIVY